MYLTHQELLDLHHVCLGARLASKRDVLLAGLDPLVAAQLPTAPDPNAQLLSDLSMLNAMVLVDGAVPFVQWLQTAEVAIHPRAEARDILSDLAAQRPALRDEILAVLP